MVRVMRQLECFQPTNMIFEMAEWKSRFTPSGVHYVVPSCVVIEGRGDAGFAGFQATHVFRWQDTKNPYLVKDKG